MAARDLSLSFKYKDNDDMTGDIKEALANFDLDKSGHVSTSELVAGAKALQEVRGQNTFMRKLVLIHGVTMFFLLGGMFGLSFTAVQLSKETKVGAHGALVTPSGEAVSVASSEMYVGPKGELRQRLSADGRRLDGEDGAFVKAADVLLRLDLTAEGDADRRLYSSVFEDGAPTHKGGGYASLRRLKYKKALKFLRDMQAASNTNYFGITVEDDDRTSGFIHIQGYMTRYQIDEEQGRVRANGQLLMDDHASFPFFYVECELNKKVDSNGVKRDDKPCKVYLKPDEAERIDTSLVCMKKGACDRDWYDLVVDYSTRMALVDMPTPAPFQLMDGLPFQVPDWWTSEMSLDLR